MLVYGWEIVSGMYWLSIVVPRVYVLQYIVRHLVRTVNSTPFRQQGIRSRRLICTKQDFEGDSRSSTEERTQYRSARQKGGLLDRGHV